MIECKIKKLCDLLDKSVGVEFLPREKNNVPFFTPPQTQPVVHPTATFDDAAIQASLQSDASDLRYHFKNILPSLCSSVNPRHVSKLYLKVCLGLCVCMHACMCVCVLTFHFLLPYLCYLEMRRTHNLQIINQ